MITFAFGLVHGFGFSFALRQTLQFAGAHMLSSLLSFNVGVEIGQLLVLVVVLPALALLFRYVVVEKLGHHPAVGARGTHGVALDAGPRVGAERVLMAGVRRRDRRSGRSAG